MAVPAADAAAMTDDKVKCCRCGEILCMTRWDGWSAVLSLTVAVLEELYPRRTSYGEYLGLGDFLRWLGLMTTL